MVFKKTLKKRFRPVKTPTYLQMEIVECGAAALGIILAYYKKFIPLEELRIACGISRDGSNALNIIKAARCYGLIAKGFKREPNELNVLKPPYIVFWNFNHFIVVNGFKKNRVYLNDPATGPRTVTHPEFDQAFTGVVLLFEPGPDFIKSGQKASLFRSIKSRISKSKIVLTYIILAGLGLVIPGLVIPSLTRIFIDQILVDHLTAWIKPLFIGIGITALVQIALVWLQEYYLSRFQTKLALQSASQFLNHILKLPIEFFSQRFGGEIGARIVLNDRVAAMLSGEIATTVISVSTILFYAAIMLFYDWVLTLIGVSIILSTILLLKAVAKYRIDNNLKLQMETGKLIGMSISGLKNIETIKATGTENDFFAKWAGYQAKMLNTEQELAKPTLLLTVIPPLLIASNHIAILGIGGLRVMEGHITIGMLIAFQGLMANFTMPVTRLVNLSQRFQDLESDMNRLDDVLRHRTDPHIDLNNHQIDLLSTPKLTGFLELKNVTFGYNRLDQPLIENLNLKMKPGDRIAIIGPSGCGKSTISKLVSGLYEPWDGEILLDHQRRNIFPRQVLANSISLVDQDIYLFEGSIKDNLQLWDQTIPEQDMIKAAKDADIHEVIAARPLGYDSAVDEDGHNFSGGQKQRLEIARSLATNPSILIMDEATSALDSHTEKIIDQNLRKRGMTMLIIAHRLSTIRDCDEIIVLDKGKIIQRGTHDQLILEDGLYKNLILSE